jgi:hypothetical protein
MPSIPDSEATFLEVCACVIAHFVLKTQDDQVQLALDMTVALAERNGMPARMVITPHGRLVLPALCAQPVLT